VFTQEARDLAGRDTEVMFKEGQDSMCTLRVDAFRGDEFLKRVAKS
jgi:hypothetical protein